MSCIMLNNEMKQEDNELNFPETNEDSEKHQISNHTRLNHNELQNTNIYCLELKNGYYYVGKSHDIESRFITHMEGNACSWTCIHKPLRIIQVLKNVNPFEEDRMVKQYMGLYGIDKVRGGTYVREILSRDEIYFIQREIWSAYGRCIRCGRDNHFASGCHANTDIYDSTIDDWESICDTCDRNGHRSSQCRAKTKKDGTPLI